MNPPSAPSKELSILRLARHCFQPALWLTIRGRGRLSVQGAVYVLNVPFFNSFFIAVFSETDATLFFIVSISWFSCKFDANWGNDAKRFSHPMEFDERRITLQALIGEQHELDRPSSHSRVIESAQRTPYNWPRLTTQESTELVRLTASRRKARWHRKHKQAAALSFMKPVLVLFSYAPFLWYLETRKLTWLDTQRKHKESDEVCSAITFNVANLNQKCPWPRWLFQFLELIDKAGVLSKCMFCDSSDFRFGRLVFQTAEQIDLSGEALCLPCYLSPSTNLILLKS
jgi:hypothetical protein